MVWRERLQVEPAVHDAAGEGGGGRGRGEVGCLRGDVIGVSGFDWREGGRDITMLRAAVRGGQGGTGSIGAAAGDGRDWRGAGHCRHGKGMAWLARSGTPPVPAGRDWRGAGAAPGEVGEGFEAGGRGVHTGGRGGGREGGGSAPTDIRSHPPSKDRPRHSGPEALPGPNRSSGPPSLSPPPPSLTARRGPIASPRSRSFSLSSPLDGTGPQRRSGRAGDVEGRE